jgi:wyosine [tRNA(Phe)-imidazoG37] synthetase (radical SAM superfamily)
MKEANGRVPRLMEQGPAPVLACSAADPVRGSAACPREFFPSRFVYTVISARARGLSVGVNMNPDKRCQFNCLYCEVDRSVNSGISGLDVSLMASELKKTLAFVYGGRLREVEAYRKVPDELLQLRHVALSGDGEPTMAPEFAEALQAVMHVRALAGFPFFKIVLITNAVGLDLPAVQLGIRRLTRSDEIWAKLDGGTEGYLNRINGINVPLKKILANILLVGQQRPIVIQSLFPAINGQEPALDEVLQYARRIQELRQGGAQISLVQIYSATRPAPRSDCGHLPLRVLSQIAQTVRQVAGVKAEVF